MSSRRRLQVRTQRTPPSMATTPAQRERPKVSNIPNIEKELARARLYLSLRIIKCLSLKAEL